MFSKSNNQLQAGATTLISKVTQIEGQLHFNGHLEIEGIVTGNVIAHDEDNAFLRVQAGGKVEGKIQVPTIVVNGTVEGDIHSTKHLELAAQAVVRGNIYYRSLEVVKGADVSGKMVHEQPESVIVVDED